MRVLLMILIAAASLSVCGGYSAFGRRRLGECEGFLSLMRFARGQVGCFLRPIGEWKNEFEDENLARCGFLAVLRENGNLGEAFEKSRSTLALSEEEKNIVGEFARSFGKGYREDEIRQIDYYRQELERLIAAEKENIPKTVKLVNALSVTLALSLIVLLL